MNIKPIIREIKCSVIRAEHELSKGRKDNADKHLYNIYNFIHFGRVWLSSKQIRNRPPDKPNS